MRPPCPECKSKNPKKNGFVKQRQRWKCRSCGYEFTRLTRYRTCQRVKVSIAESYESGDSCTSLGKKYKVSPSTIMNWVGEVAPSWHYVHWRRKKLRYLKPMRELVRACAVGL